MIRFHRRISGSGRHLLFRVTGFDMHLIGSGHKIDTTGHTALGAAIVLRYQTFLVVCETKHHWTESHPAWQYFRNGYVPPVPR